MFRNLSIGERERLTAIGFTVDYGGSLFWKCPSLFSINRFIITLTFQDKKSLLDWQLFCMGAKHDFFTLDVRHNLPVFVNKFINEAFESTKNDVNE